MQHRLRKALIAGAVLLGALAAAAPALAVWTPGLSTTPRSGVPSEVTLSGIGAHSAVTGFIGPVGSTSDPLVPYPTVIDPGFTALDEGIAGVIFAQPPGPAPPTLQMYCINIRTPTNVGFGYSLGTWNEANVTNVGFVARVLNDYFPHIPAEPAAAVGDAAKAGAVQAAIWYFADNYVLALTDPLRPITESIVNAVVAAGPLPEPTAPSLAITPTTATIDAPGDAGPFTISTSDPTGAAISATGATMVASDGTTIIANGTKVPNGTQIFLRSATPGSAVLTAAAVELVARSHVYLYTGNTTAPQGQKLILAEDETVTTTATAGVTFTTATTTTTTTTTTTAPTTTTTAPTTTTTASTTTTTASTSTTVASTTTTSTTATTGPAATTTTAAVAPEDTGSLPPTGAGGPPLDAVLLAALAVVGGGWLVFLARRRQAT